MSNRAREALIRDRVAYELGKSDGYVKTELRIPLTSDGGRRKHYRSIDVYAEKFGVKYIIEIKAAKLYHSGIGQLLAYRALHCPTCELVLVLYGSPAEIRQYSGECQLVLNELRKRNGLMIKLMMEIG